MGPGWRSGWDPVRGQVHTVPTMSPGGAAAVAFRRPLCPRPHPAGPVGPPVTGRHALPPPPVSRVARPTPAPPARRVAAPTRVACGDGAVSGVCRITRRRTRLPASTPPPAAAHPSPCHPLRRRQNGGWPLHLPAPLRPRRLQGGAWHQGSGPGGCGEGQEGLKRGWPRAFRMLNSRCPTSHTVQTDRRTPLPPPFHPLRCPATALHPFTLALPSLPLAQQS